MNRILSWLLMIPLGALVVAFTASNRSRVLIDLSPAPYSFEIPVFAAVLGAAFFGFLCGGVISFLSAGRRRARNRELIRMLDNARREEINLRAQITKLKTANAPQASAPALLTKADAA